MPSYKDIRSQINTGDIVLFSCRDNIVSIGIQLMTQSKWSHVGMVLKDCKKDIIYLWESTTLSDIKDAIDNTPKKGVQIVLLSERIKHYNGEITIRHLQGIKIEDDSKEMQVLMQLRQELKDKPYEQNKLELLRAAIDRFRGICKNKEDLSSIFCSELIAEAYQRMGLLEDSEPSNEYVPKDFSEEGKLRLLNGAYLGPEIMIEKLIILPEQEVVLVAA